MKGYVAGAGMSVLFFKKKKWPKAFFAGFGFGVGMEHCEGGLENKKKSTRY